MNGDLSHAGAFVMVILFPRERAESYCRITGKLVQFFVLHFWLEVVNTFSL